MISTKQARDIARILVEVAQEVVWPVIERFSREHDLLYSNHLECRVGNGKKTYHCLDRTHPGIGHKVIFGQLMVQSKYIEAHAAAWLSGREILEYGYFESRLGIPELFAHVVLHELAHAIQSKAGERTFGSVHNEAFYRWLTCLHEEVGQETLQIVTDRMGVQGFPLDFTEKEKRGQTTSSGPEHFQVGDECVVNGREGRWTGQIEKLNPKRAIVRRSADKSRFRVPYAMMRPFVDDSTEARRAPENKRELDRSFLTMEYQSDIWYRDLQFPTAKHLYVWLHVDPSATDWLEAIRLAPLQTNFEQWTQSSRFPARPEAVQPEFSEKALKRAVWQKFQNRDLREKLMELPRECLRPEDAVDFPELTPLLHKLHNYLSGPDLSAARGAPHNQSAASV